MIAFYDFNNVVVTHSGFGVNILLPVLRYTLAIRLISPSRTIAISLVIGRSRYPFAVRTFTIRTTPSVPGYTPTTLPIG
jgi:hypothetical protein